MQFIVPCYWGTKAWKIRSKSEIHILYLFKLNFLVKQYLYKIKLFLLNNENNSKSNKSIKDYNLSRLQVKMKENNFCLRWSIELEHATIIVKTGFLPCNSKLLNIYKNYLKLPHIGYMNPFVLFLSDCYQLTFKWYLITRING